MGSLYAYTTINVLDPRSLLVLTSINVTPANVGSYLTGSIIYAVDNIYDELYGSIQVIPFATYEQSISGSIQIEGDSTFLPGTITVPPLSESYLLGYIETYSDIPEYVDLYGFIEVSNRSESLLSGSISTGLAGQSQLSGSIMVPNGVDLSGSIHVVNPYAELSGSITTQYEFGNPAINDQLNSIDRININKYTATVYSQFIQETLIISPYDELEQLELLERGDIYISGTSEVLGVNPTDELFTLLYGELGIDWSYPIKLTHNLWEETQFINPSVTFFEDNPYISYNEILPNKQIKNTVLKGDKENIINWAPIKVYNNILDAQFIGPSGSMIHENGQGFSINPGPQEFLSQEFFDADLTFSTNSYYYSEDLYKDLWETIQYQMQKNGQIIYPPPQWNHNPISEIIEAPIDIFDPIPKHSDYIPSGTDGYYQDFNNIFT